MPEDPVGRVDLRYVAKQPLGVNFVEDRVALQVQQAVEKELRMRNSFRRLRGTNCLRDELHFGYFEWLGKYNLEELNCRCTDTHVLYHFESPNVVNFGLY